MIAVGEATAKKITERGGVPWKTARFETAEGIIKLLSAEQLQNSYIFWPHSALSRRAISLFLQKQNIQHQECILYDTIPTQETPPPALNNIDRIIFTSPSTVDAYMKIYGEIPPHLEIETIGPITEAHLAQIAQFRQNDLDTQRN